MKSKSLRSVALVATLCFLVVGLASASPLPVFPVIFSSYTPPNAHVNVNVPFPTAGDTYCSMVYGCGTIPVAGATDYLFNAGDYVISSIFVLQTQAVTDLTANWSFVDYLGGGSTETWFVYVNGVAVAQTILPDCNYCGNTGTVTGTVNFAAIAPVNGGYQVALVLQNTVAYGGGSAQWLDGGVTGLSYDEVVVPEPGSLMLFGSGALGLAGLLRRRLGM